MATTANGTVRCETCGGALAHGEVPAGKLDRELVAVLEQARLIEADARAIQTRALTAADSPSLGRLSGRLEELARRSKAAAWTADYVAREAISERKDHP